MTGVDPELPPAAYLAALAALPGAGPARLGAVLAEHTPAEAWSALTRGELRIPGAPTELAQRWQSDARATDPDCVLAELRQAGIGTVDMGSPGYPTRLTHDPEPPPVLFTDGDLACLATRCVAIVGTRQCTRYGVDIAYELGARLAGHGVTVVSGLAAGIDAAAHSGALSVTGATPAGVVACGLDRPYPRQNTQLWRAVASAGIVISEAPLGVRPERWRFPARNRIIAGLSELVIVVESHVTGGSLYTAVEAIERDIPVLAVPGPIRSAASAGTNRLVADGCHPLCEIDDVFELLELVAAPAEQPMPPPESLTTRQQQVLDAIAWQPTTLERIVEWTGLTIAEVTDGLEHLSASDRVTARGRWFERTIRGQGVLP